MDSLWIPRNITSFETLCYEAIDSSVSQNILLYLKMFSMQCKKSITVEDNKKRMNIANFIYTHTHTHTHTYIYIYIYTNIYTYIIFDENDSK